MTLLVTDATLTQQIALNLRAQVDYVGPVGFSFFLTSQWSHEPIQLPVSLVTGGNRYSVFQITFPAGFGDEHKNGIYNWRLMQHGDILIEAGLAKIITEPGGSLGTVNYTSTPDTEERVADVYYRPNY